MPQPKLVDKPDLIMYQLGNQLIQIKGACFLLAAYRCKSKDNWFINTLYAYMNVIYKKSRGIRFRMNGTVLIVPNDERILARQHQK
jgi:hypothetical protein